MASDDYTDRDKQQDVAVLHSMGYAQELQRSMSKFSNFAISFSIICILSGGINSFAQAISSVGGAGAGIGWIVGCLLSGMFALAMAQIASAFPTAGGLYHWASILGNRFWGWLTIWPWHRSPRPSRRRGGFITGRPSLETGSGAG